MHYFMKFILLFSLISSANASEVYLPFAENTFVLELVDSREELDFFYRWRKRNNPTYS